MESWEATSPKEDIDGETNDQRKARKTGQREQKAKSK